MRDEGWDDEEIFDSLCANCVDSLVTYLFLYNYQGALEALQGIDPVYFQVLLNLYSPDPPPPDPPYSPPQQVSNIMAASSARNAVYQLGQSGFGMQCNTFRAVWNQLLGFNSGASRSVFLNNPDFKSCLKSAFADQTISAALITSVGYSQVWDWLVNHGTYDEDDYLADIKDNYPQQLLYYATLEINTNAFMSLMVGHMFTSTTLEWLAAVKSRFGVDYYQNML
jgi:hypothetical protein